MKEYSAFPKVQPLLEPHHQIVFKTLMGGGSLPSAEVQSVYSTASTDWAILSRGSVGIFYTHNQYAGLLYIHPFYKVWNMYSDV